VQIASNTIQGNNVQIGTLTGNLIAGNTITGNTIRTGTITGNLVASNTITGNLITIGTITGNLVAANTIVGTNIVGGTITGNLIQANTLTGNLIAANTIAGTNIIGGTITGSLIAANTIVGTNIQAGTITTNLFAANLVLANDIASIGQTIGVNSGTGYWLQGNTGNAYFGGTVNVAGNFNVAGLITARALQANTVATNNIVYGSVNTNQIAAGATSTFTGNIGGAFTRSAPVSGTPYYTGNNISFSASSGDTLLVTAVVNPNLNFSSLITGGQDFQIGMEIVIINPDSSVAFTFTESVDYIVWSTYTNVISFPLNLSNTSYVATQTGTFQVGLYVYWVVGGTTIQSPSSIIVTGSTLSTFVQKR